MSDGLDYIRKAIREGGRQARVTVVRWEKNPKTGFYDKPFNVVTNATMALKNLTMPLIKRARVWKMVMPLGHTPGNISVKGDQNSLSDPNLIETIKQQLRAELKAEMAQELATVEAAKKTRKKKEVVEAPVNSPEAIEESTEDATDLNELDA